MLKFSIWFADTFCIKRRPPPNALTPCCFGDVISKFWRNVWKNVVSEKARIMFAYFIFCMSNLYCVFYCMLSSEWVFFFYTFCGNLTAACLLRINGDFIEQEFAGSAVYSFTPAQLLSQEAYLNSGWTVKVRAVWCVRACTLWLIVVLGPSQQAWNSLYIIIENIGLGTIALWLPNRASGGALRASWHW